ncbi:ComEA family DNA-binding protein [Thiothrix lacustris]|uniref:Helix-hairpin-helix domain-containing protein n=1 Tax=Thiothrix lacustris TaxID=525917 RepID=A0ABY9MP42_9GAMM|nr:helix-hairpin-helix domain-containing protein [Thiothrix lacustris]WML90429.1 helix-hairpin-helix domain-containing protein [Thiothrix lacustris]WMP17919.1 helix-hairpin-helix domain-containing protein [Thiothrix lacustris]
MKKIIAITSLLASLFVSPLVMAEAININTADVAALDSLEGIGAKKAEAIIAYRTQHGEFKALEELKEVPGIGDKMFDKIKENIALTDGTTQSAEPVAEKDVEKVVDVADKPADKATTDAAASATVEVKDEKAAVKEETADKKADAAVVTDKVSNKAEVKADKS